MEQPSYSSCRMGKNYFGGSPCIDPLSMAELMIRLENRRRLKQPQKPCIPVPQRLLNLLTRCK